MKTKKKHKNHKSSTNNQPQHKQKWPGQNSKNIHKTKIWTKSHSSKKLLMSVCIQLWHNIAQNSSEIPASYPPDNH